MNIKRYSLNNSFLLRIDEQLIFDSKKYIVHKFNTLGMEIMSLFAKSPLTAEVIAKFFPNIKPFYIKTFIDKAVVSKILIEIEPDSVSQNVSIKSLSPQHRPNHSKAVALGEDIMDAQTK